MRMIVCVCQNVSDKTLCRMVREGGVRNLREARAALGVAAQCGRCAECARAVIGAELDRQARTCAATQPRPAIAAG
jgi:bacterioferritin-associated ferredoxin